MFFTEISNQFTTLKDSLTGFVPELLVCAAIVVMLLLRLLPGLKMHMAAVVLPICTFALLLSVFQWNDAGKLNVLGPINGNPDPKDFTFTGLIVVDHFTVFLRILLLGFAILMTVLSAISGIPDEEDSADFFTLLLGGTLGMMLMASANHLMMVFIAVEMASLPCYALAGFLKGRRQSSEASLKYVVYGGGASGIMLYGISLISGKFGTGYLPNVATCLQEQMKTGAGTLAGLDTIVLLGIVFILVGLGFKLSAVPFHFWAPDVFEGAAAEVGAFLSVASKAAALALTGRLLLSLASGPHREALEPVQKTLGPAIAFFAALTATFGNLAAYPQTNLKRLLAYSTIAHAGYMLMGFAPLNQDGTKAVLFYLVAYVFMNLGAFAIVAFIRNRIGSEDLRDMRGLVYRSPWAVILLGVFMLSLLGLPPLWGFAAKFQIFAVLFDAGREFTRRAQASGTSPALGYTMYALLLIGGINTVISAVYYLRVMKVMILDRPVEELEDRPAKPLRFPIGGLIYGGLLGLVIFVGGVAWNPIEEQSAQGVVDFKSRAVSAPPPIPPSGVGGGAGGGGGGGPGRPGNNRPGGGGPPQRSKPAPAWGARQ